MLDEPEETPNRGPRSSSPDDAQWLALENHLRAAAAAAERWDETTRVAEEDAARLAGMLHDIGKAQTAFQVLSMRRTVPDGVPPASRRFGAFAGKFDVDDGFFDPLSEAELTAWSGG